MRVHHIKASHPSIWDLISYLFEVPEKKDLPHQQITWTPNPESCSTEEMTKEELSQDITSNPELRKALFRRWKQMKETKNSNQ